MAEIDFQFNEVIGKFGQFNCFGQHCVCPVCRDIGSCEKCGEKTR